MTELNGSDAGPLGVGAGCVQPRDGKQVCSSTEDLCLLLLLAWLFCASFLGKGRVGVWGSATRVVMLKCKAYPLCYCTKGARGFYRDDGVEMGAGVAEMGWGIL